MKPSLQLRVSQNLAMTPQLQQAIRLLQLSNIELQMEVQQALESNMMLEIDDGEDNEQTEQQSEEYRKVKSGDQINEDDIPQVIPEELPVDSVWEDVYDSSISFSPGLNNNEAVFFENQNLQEKSLRDHLLWQLNVIPVSEKDKAIAITIIDALDDDGYLSCKLEEILDALGDDIEVELDEVEAVLNLIQAMEPAGVGARNLQECLILQLNQCPATTPWLDKAKELVGRHLELMAAHDFNQLMRRLKVTQKELQEIITLIQTMNPRPGTQVQSTQTEYVIPDVYVKKDMGMWKVELNPDSIPHLKINTSYANMIRRADNSTDNTSLKTHLQEARWFIKSLQSRSETLLRVASCIVERQRAFLEYGDEAMKPLVLHDVAEALGMHESTISRVTTRKYLHTPRGIYELKYFFSSHVNTNQGDACSSTAIRALIKKLINEEPPQKPLSDNRIAELLSARGIQVARRTVAKYREAMAIPPSNERKRLV
ncbi:MAG: RNA polymerase factor sigma-54 [Gammaproteobacteria bacterium]|nr:RNA polymerase factor sigma-54 [Gammaproteobacteria bacterium]